MPPRVDWTRADATTDAEIVRHEAEDEAEARQDAATWARQVRQRLGLSQADFSRRIGVPLGTVRDWEHGRRTPDGPARALLLLIDRAPEAALVALPG